MLPHRNLKLLKTLIAFRVVFVTLLLGSFLYFQIGRGIFPYPFSVVYVIIFLYAASIAYALTLGRIPMALHGYTQMVMDTLASMALIFMTGGIESWFSWLLLMVVFLSALVVGRRAAYIMATVGSLLYGLVINWQFYGVIPLPYKSMLEEKDFVYKSFSHIGGLYLIAFLSGQLATRLERSREDLRDLSRFNRDVIESSPSGIITTDRDGIALMMNRSAESILNTNRYDVIGRRLAKTCPFLAPVKAEERTEITLGQNDEARTIGYSVSDLQDASGKKTGFLCTFQDLSEIALLTQEVKRQENLAAIGELSAKIAHEIRNPLASLRSSMELLREGSLDPDKQNHLMTIALTEMDRLNATITDFLKFSRPSPLRMSRFDLSLTLSEVLGMLKNRDQSHSVKFSNELESPLAVTADQGKFRDVFWNLGINALEAIGGSGRIMASARSGGDNVIIMFEDDGPGFDDKSGEKVFYPFYTTKADGTGLGLSTVYRVVQDHKGTIQTGRSRWGGAAITISLPKDND